MRFGLNVINAWPAEYLLRLAIAADKSGWDGFFLWDHVSFEFPATLQDPWVLLGAIAARTSRLRLGTLVTPLARRRPHVVARETVTLDHLSKGRSVLGVGLGGTELEFAAFGDEGDAKIRAERLDEALEVITKLWSGELVEYYGRYYTVSKISFVPTPVQKPRIPIWVGGHSKAAQRRASRYDGWAPGGPAPSVGEAGMGLVELRESIAYVLKHREKGNLEPFQVVYSVELPEDDEEIRETARSFEDIGVTWVLESIHGIRYPGEQAMERILKGPPVVG